MGPPEGKEYANEHPQHMVMITRPFRPRIHTVTQGHPTATPQGRSLGMSAFCRAARGTTHCSTFVARTATTAEPRTSITTASDFGWY